MSNCSIIGGNYRNRKDYIRNSEIIEFNKVLHYCMLERNLQLVKGKSFNFDSVIDVVVETAS